MPEVGTTNTPQDPPAPGRRISLWWWLAGVVVILVGSVAGARFFSHSALLAPAVIVSPETTYVTEPLAADGLPDYVAAVNRHFGRGVTPENNAAVLLLEALGPQSLDVFPPRVYAQLGTQPPRSDLPTFISWESFAHKQGVQDVTSLAWSERCEPFLQRPWDPQQQPLLARWLERNRRTLDLAVQACRRPRYFVPVIRSPEDTLLEARMGHMLTFREVSRGLCARAMLRLHQKQYAAAWEDLLTTWRLGRLLTQGWSVVGYFMGSAIQWMAYRATGTFLAVAPLDEKTLRRYRRQLEQLPPVADPVDCMALSERLALLEVFLHGARGRRVEILGEELLEPLSALSSQHLDWNEALRVVNAGFDHLQQALQHRDLEELNRVLRSFRQQRREYTDSTWAWLAAQVNRRARSRYLAAVLLDLMSGPQEPLLRVHFRLRQQHQLALVAFSLSAYRRRQGSYPQRLEQLVPQALPRVPQDVFGRRLVYRPGTAGCLLYSLGVNGRDDQGRFDLEEGVDDFSLRLPPPWLAEPLEPEPPLPPGASLRH